MTVTPRKPINDGLWRALVAEKTLVIPYEIYIAQRIDHRHEISLEEVIDDGVSISVRLGIHQDYYTLLHGCDQ